MQLKMSGKDSKTDIITKQHDKKDWGYKCNDQPMCSLCDKKLCKTRKFGIGQEAVFPNLTDLQVVNLEEPYYYMNVDGDRLYLEYLLRKLLKLPESCTCLRSRII